MLASVPIASAAVVPAKIIRRSITSAILSVGRPLGKRGRARYNPRVFTLHPQLQTDCHPLGKLTGGRLLLHRNAAVTWFILVPETEAADLLDLPEAQLNSIMADGRALSAFLKNERNFPKVNFGAIGNLVPQLHLHIVGRTPEDACWPQPVWGNLPEGPAYTEPEIETLRNQLIEHCDLQPVD